MNTKDLFSTPDQGRRLKELLPEINSHLVWQRIPYWSEWAINFVKPDNKYHEVYPALTLQELRDVMLKLERRWKTLNGFSETLWDGTAPELAAWVIERLEEVER